MNFLVQTPQYTETLFFFVFVLPIKTWKFPSKVGYLSTIVVMLCTAQILNFVCFIKNSSSCDLYTMTAFKFQLARNSRKLKTLSAFEVWDDSD